jgi:UDP-glucuronate decarboxylase
VERVGNGTFILESPAEFVGPLHLGNPNAFRIRELAELVVELTGSRSDIEYRPLPQDDPMQRRPDISTATKGLDWTPKVQLREGLSQTIAYFIAREFKDQPVACEVAKPFMIAS